MQALQAVTKPAFLELERFLCLPADSLDTPACRHRRCRVVQGGK